MSVWIPALKLQIRSVFKPVFKQKISGSEAVDELIGNESLKPAIIGLTGTGKFESSHVPLLFCFPNGHKHRLPTFSKPLPVSQSWQNDVEA